MKSISPRALPRIRVLALAMFCLAPAAMQCQQPRAASPFSTSTSVGMLYGYGLRGDIQSGRRDRLQEQRALVAFPALVLRGRGPRLQVQARDIQETRPARGSLTERKTVAHDRFRLPERRWGQDQLFRKRLLHGARHPPRPQGRLGGSSRAQIEARGFVGFFLHRSSSGPRATAIISIRRAARAITSIPTA